MFKIALPLMVASLSLLNGADLSCDRQILLKTYPPAIVLQTLTTFKVGEERAQKIVDELQAKDSEIIPLVESKAKEKEVELFEPRFRQEAIALYGEAVFEIFNEVLADNGIIDSQQAKEMLDVIQDEKARKFAKCLESGEILLEEPQ